MKKIKILRCNNEQELVRITNVFSKDKNIIDIRLQTAFCNKSFNSSGVPIEAEFIDTALIIYEE